MAVETPPVNEVPRTLAAGPPPRLLGLWDQTSLWANLGISLLLLVAAAFLLQLKGVTGAVKTVGKEKVRGDNTTHYSFTVDLDKAAQLAPSDQKAGIEAAAKTVVNKQEPTEVWLDGKGRVRRLKQTVQIASGALTGTTNLTLEYFDFGTKVDATPPPADQTADFTQLLGGLGSG